MTSSTGGAADRVAIAAPLVLDAKGDLLFFKSVAHLEAYVEAADVTNGKYGACWDADGRMLQLTVERQTTAILGVVPYHRPVVRVLMLHDAANHQAELHFALLRYLEDVCLAGEMPVTNDTADLLDFAVEHAGWS